MWEAIKSLNPKQRFFGFILTLLVTSAVTIGTVYFKTDDCAGISDQYTVLVKNYTDLIKINNELVAFENQRQRDFGQIRSLVASLDQTEKTITTKTRNPRQTESYPISIVSDSIQVSAMVKPHSQIREITTTITEKPLHLKTTRDSLLSLVDKYIKK